MATSDSSAAGASGLGTDGCFRCSVADGIFIATCCGGCGKFSLCSTCSLSFRCHLCVGAVQISPNSDASGPSQKSSVIASAVPKTLCSQGAGSGLNVGQGDVAGGASLSDKLPSAGRLLCANPLCSYLVNRNASVFGSFCCKFCHAHYANGCPDHWMHLHGKRCEKEVSDALSCPRAAAESPPEPMSASDMHFHWRIQPLRAEQLSNWPSTTVSPLKAMVWEDFFHGQIGHAHVFAQFEVDSAKKMPGGSFLYRLPVVSTSETVQIRATVWGGSCNSASSIEFEIDNDTIRYFRDGAQSSWRELLDVKIVSGEIVEVPTHIWTGCSSKNRGWILSKGHNTFASTFASSYGYKDWDRCNGSPLAGGEMVKLSYRVVALSCRRQVQTDPRSVIMEDMSSVNGSAQDSISMGGSAGPSTGCSPKLSVSVEVSEIATFGVSRCPSAEQPANWTLASRLKALLHDADVTTSGGALLKDAQLLVESIGLEGKSVREIVQEAEIALYGSVRLPAVETKSVGPES